LSNNFQNSIFQLVKQHRLLDSANGLKFHYFASCPETMQLVVTVTTTLHCNDSILVG